MTLKEKLKAVINSFACEQDWNIHEYAIRKRDIDYRRGKADAYRDVVHRLEEIIDKTAEPVGNSDKMTLTELANELRKLVSIRYVTIGKSDCGDLCICGFRNKPLYLDRFLGDNTNFWFGDALFNINIDILKGDLDLSEYTNEKGNVDYSKCIVEVE